MATVDVTLYLGECLDILPTLPAQSVDLIVTDLPYGTTACKWDVIIPFEPMWKEVKRILKPHGAFVTTASQPFTSALVMSNIKMFKYCWIWNKKLAGNGILAKIQPLKIHEDIVVFSKGKVRYFPQMEKGIFRKKLTSLKISEVNNGDGNKKVTPKANDSYYPVTILDFSLAGLRRGRLHPTQKPVALYEYLIKTYSNPGDTVMDFCMGSGTTGVACVQLGRNFIGIETDEKYFNIANERIK